MEPLKNQVRLNGMATLLPHARRVARRASDLRGYFADDAALEALIRRDNPVIYEVFEPSVPEAPGQIMYGISVLYPGRVGREYFMTKGHYHARRETAEVYYGLDGQGRLVLQSGDGRSHVDELGPGTVIYVPPGWAHRSVNVGARPLVFLYAFPADAGHDYAAIEQHGFAKLVVDQGGTVAVVDRSSWLAVLSRDYRMR